MPLFKSPTGEREGGFKPPPLDPRLTPVWKKRKYDFYRCYAAAPLQLVVTVMITCHFYKNKKYIYLFGVELLARTLFYIISLTIYRL